MREGRRQKAESRRRKPVGSVGSPTHRGPRAGIPRGVVDREGSVRKQKAGQCLLPTARCPPLTVHRSLLTPAGRNSRALFINLAQAVQNQTCVAGSFDGYGEGLWCFLEFKHAAGNFDYLTKGVVRCELAGFRAYNLAVVEKNAPGLRIVAEHQRAGEPRIFNRLNRVEYADGRKIAGERGAGPDRLAFGLGGRLRLQIRMARATNC